MIQRTKYSDKKYKSEQNRYLPLNNSDNLHYWVLLRETVKGEVDQSVLAVVGIALAADLMVIVLFLARWLLAKDTAKRVQEVRGVLLFQVLSIFIITILSCFLIHLILVVVRLNNKVSRDTIVTLEQGRLELAVEACRMEKKKAELLTIKKTPNSEKDFKKNTKCSYKTRAERKRTVVSGPERGNKPEDDDDDEDGYMENVENNAIIKLDAEKQRALERKHDRKLLEVTAALAKLEAHRKLVHDAVENIRIVDLPISLLGLPVNQEFMVKVCAVTVSGAGTAALQLIGNPFASEATV